MMVMMVVMVQKELPGVSRVAVHFVGVVAGLRVALAVLLNAVRLVEKGAMQGMMTVMVMMVPVASVMVFVLQMAVQKWPSTKATGHLLVLMLVSVT